MNAHLFDLDNVLDNGDWVRHGMVWRWEASEHRPVNEPRDYRPHDLIACPVCLARMDESCKTKRGTSHEGRLVKRVCSCGDSVRMREPMCGSCRAEMARAA